MTDPLIGKILNGSYRIESALADGGMGVVYIAEQLSLARKVVLKILRASFFDEDFVELFLREARINSQLNHPNVVSVFDFGKTEDDIVFLAMEYLDGQTLNDIVVAQGGLSLAKCLWVMEQICSSVNAAHKMQVVHRDIKPNNVMISAVSGDTMIAKILDFGISKPLQEQDLKHTRMGMVMGTPGYIAPEQISGQRDIDTRVDIYALGALLYFMMTGKAPYQGASGEIIMNRQLSKPLEPLDSTSLVDPKVSILFPAVEKAMALERSERYPDVKQFWTDVVNCAKSNDGSNRNVNDQLQTLGAIGAEEVIQDATRIINREQRAEIDNSLPTVSLLEAISVSDIKSAEDFHARQNKPTNTSLGSVQRSSHPKYSVNQGSQPSTSKSGIKLRLLSSGLLLVLLVTTAWIYKPLRYAAMDAFWYTLTGADKPRGVNSETIQMGMTAAFSGSAQAIGHSMRLGIHAYFNRINSLGGIHGRALKLIDLDDGYEPDRAIDNVAKFLEKESGVFAMIGNVGTPTAKAILPLALESKTILFATFSGSPILRNNPPDRYVFNYRASYGEETAKLIHYFVGEQEVDPKRIAVLYQNDSYGTTGLIGVEEALEKYGISHRDIISASYKRNTSQVSAAVDVLSNQENPLEAIILVSTYAASAQFIKEIRLSSYEGVFGNVSFVGSRALAERLQEIGESGQGVIISQVVPLYTSYATGVLQYREDLAKYYPGEAPNFISLEGYIIAAIFSEALQRAGRYFDTERVVDALETLNNFDLGIGTDINFSGSTRNRVGQIRHSEVAEAETRR